MGADILAVWSPYLKSGGSISFHWSRSREARTAPLDVQPPRQPRTILSEVLSGPCSQWQARPCHSYNLPLLGPSSVLGRPVFSLSSQWTNRCKFFCSTLPNFNPQPFIPERFLSIFKTPLGVLKNIQPKKFSSLKDSGVWEIADVVMDDTVGRRTFRNSTWNGDRERKCFLPLSGWSTVANKPKTLSSIFLRKDRKSVV